MLLGALVLPNHASLVMLTEFAPARGTCAQILEGDS